MANRAVKTGRRVVLEPMNPYERRVLHTALQNHPAVTTHSEGEEPNRRVVIMLKNQPERPEKSAEKPQSDRPNNRRRSHTIRTPENDCVRTVPPAPPPQQPPPRTAQAGQSGRKSACE